VGFPFRSDAHEEKWADHMRRAQERWPGKVPFESLRVNTSYGETFVRSFGKEGGRNLLLLPGAGCSSLIFAPIAAALTEQHKVYAVDSIYDIGMSRPQKGVKIESPVDLMAWLEELSLELFSAKKFSLMGFSYGGWVSAEYKLRNPEQIDKLVLLAPAAVGVGLSSQFLLRASSCMLPYGNFTSKFYRWLAKELPYRVENGEKYIQEWIEDTNTALQCYRWKSVVQPRVFPLRQFLELGSETRILIGEDEKIYSPESFQQRIEKLNSQASLQIIPRAGHHLFHYQAQEVSQAILNFLSKAV